MMKNLARLLFLIFLFLIGCSKNSPKDVNESILSDPTEPLVDPMPLTVPPSGLVPCDGGLAGNYPCLGYDLQSMVSLPLMGASMGNDNWGWTDSESGKEYVLMGLDNGTAFIDISTPDQPVFLGKLNSATTPSIWRDIKVFQDHAFIVSEADGHGLQVFDLTSLRNLTEVQNFTADARLTAFGSAHNIAIDEASGFAYVVGSSLYQGGPAFIDINDPTNPTLVGGFGDESYTHDAQILIYEGPDTEYQGKEILFGSNSDGGENNQIIIVDVTDKTSPKLISSSTYSNGGYTHQGWIDEDHKYFYLGDELDESQYGNYSRTLVFDMEDLDNPILHHTYLGTTAAIDHNGYIKGNSFFLANYTAGFREIGIQNIGSKEMEEVGFFDTFPEHDNTSFDGVWNVYPYFESGVIVISDSNSGLFLVKASQ
jgi:choice-of-anchor B domain-containing protein|tara:strand:- start:7128 stop:8402 length:1275 start_codon:yes stop_codon:yes gene_type:complete